MFHNLYEAMVQFGSEGTMQEELARAKQEYVQRTGELFETDPSFERRLSLFLEWYTLDRPLPQHAEGLTPAQAYIASVESSADPTDVERMRGIASSVLSLFEFKRAKPDMLVVVDLLRNEKHQVFERRKPAGLEPGDVLEARLVDYDGRLMFSEAFNFHPRPARKAILKAAKSYRKNGDDSVQGRIDLVHRVAYFTNRCERYKHVDPKTIFADLAA